MKTQIIKIDPGDNAIVALTDLKAGEVVNADGEAIEIREWTPAKHKFAVADLPTGSSVIMYGILVGKTTVDVLKGGRLTVDNVKHAVADFTIGERKNNWVKPDISKWSERNFHGFHREDGSVGTANYWIIIPLVFCENRNIEVLKEALVNQLGYGTSNKYRLQDFLIRN